MSNREQACKNESIVSLFISPTATYIALYFYVSSNVKRKNQYIDFLYIYIYIYIFCFFFVLIFVFREEQRSCTMCHWPKNHKNY